MNGQLRRSEQLSGRAGVGRTVPHVGRPFPQPLSPNPGKAERSPSHPSRWVGRVSSRAQEGGQRMPLGPRSAIRPGQSRIFCHQNPLGTQTHSGRSGQAQRALGYPRRAQRGRGHAPGAAGWGWGPGLCPLSLSPEPPAETRPHQRARQPARGRLPLRGPLVNPDPTSLWSGL